MIHLGRSLQVLVLSLAVYHHVLISLESVLSLEYAEREFEAMLDVSIVLDVGNSTQWNYISFKYVFLN